MADGYLVERAMCTLVLFLAWFGLCWLIVETVVPFMESGGFVRLEHLDAGGL